MTSYIWENTEWSFPLINQVYEEIEKIGVGEMGLDIYPNSIEIINSEQMLDAYSSVGMPILYKHWSFGKSFAQNKKMYDKGYQGLAYEIVINSNPCISYLMEENTMTMQALVISHACVDGDTEYLSETGWNKISSYTGGKVAQYNANGRVEFVDAIYVKNYYYGSFIKIIAPGIDQLLTPDHRVIYKDVSDNLSVMPASDLELFHHKPYFNKKFIIIHNSDKNGVEAVQEILNQSFTEISLDNLEITRVVLDDNHSYCFSVPSGMLVLRRNNKIFVTGNCMGHNTFFKNNQLFKTWTDASAIIDYLVFAKNYIARCEEKEGVNEVERFIDACHALQSYGINRYKTPNRLSIEKEKIRQKERDEYKRLQVNDLFDRLLKKSEKEDEEIFPKEPEENILYFCEKYSPDLKDWQREIIRIVRKVAQYFYPQGQTKTMNEGCATYTHHRILKRLHEKGLMNDGSMLEFLASHSNVIFQPHFDDQRYNGINPYALGFAMMQDIERAVKNPTDEDRRWFGDIAGSGDEMAVIRDAWANYRDESFVRQFLSPKVIRDFKLFRLKDSSKERELQVTAIHNDQGYQDIRDTLASQYEQNNYIPRIEVSKMEPRTRTLNLTYHSFRGRVLKNPKIVMNHIKTLWGGYPAILWDNKNNIITSV